ncbi:MAG TPA: alanine racemase [Woeseiaceae bacterium]|nr:alanine racemase [Woeseiaceae bacterium]
MGVIADIETPALILDRAKLEANIARMRDRLAGLGVGLRPHVKTAKSIDVVRPVLVGQPGGITVSSVDEAVYFSQHGVNDILYAVGVAPSKLPRLIELSRQGTDISVVLDNSDAANACNRAACAAGVQLPFLIELDVDGHRSGITPESPALLNLAAAVQDMPGVRLKGVMTHAGESYNCRSEPELVAMAEQERSGAVLAAERLRRAGYECPIVSIGSTPTALFANRFDGITEVRAGVYMFMDLVMAGLGVCDISDIALGVVVSVIGHQPEKNLVIADGGWMALSRDRGTANQPIDQGYGLVCDVLGIPFTSDLIVIATNQEHAIIARRDKGPVDPLRFPVGTLLRILPNHACATGAQHGAYHVVNGANPNVEHVWARIAGSSSVHQVTHTHTI